MKKKTIYVANWKMELPYKHAIQYAHDFHNSLATLSSDNNTEIIVCPSFESLNPIRDIFSNSSVAIGAQDCSSYPSGPYTGQVSAESLAELGCTYCIIGHSEKREYAEESTGDIGEKLQQLIHNEITPIMCIGETEKERKKGSTIYTLEQQLAPLLEIINLAQKPIKSVFIAYEPIWAIGSNKTPTLEELQEIFEILDQWCSSDAPQVQCTLLYGGSVDDKTAKELKSISLIQGFLIGRASLDFKKFKTIVSS